MCWRTSSISRPWSNPWAAVRFRSSIKSHCPALDFQGHIMLQPCCWIGNAMRLCPAMCIAQKRPVGTSRLRPNLKEPPPCPAYQPEHSARVEAPRPPAAEALRLKVGPDNIQGRVVYTHLGCLQSNQLPHIRLCFHGWETSLAGDLKAVQRGHP